jgi:hypothetical protein
MVACSSDILCLSIEVAISRQKMIRGRTAHPLTPRSTVGPHLAPERLLQLSQNPTHRARRQRIPEVGPNLKEPPAQVSCLDFARTLTPRHAMAVGMTSGFTMLLKARMRACRYTSDTQILSETSPPKTYPPTVGPTATLRLREPSEPDTV